MPQYCTEDNFILDDSPDQFGFIQTDTSFPLAVSLGGTGADNALNARDNLGITTMLSDMLPTTVKSGAMVTFADGVGNLPILDLTCDIEPAQNLNGYDFPWPKGGYQNLIPVDVDWLQSINTSGTWTDNVYSLNDLTFTITDDQTIIINGTSSAATYFNYYQNANGITLPAGDYALQKTGTSSVAVAAVKNGSAWLTARVNNQFGTIDSSSMVSFYTYVANGAQLTNFELSPMFLAGSTIPDVWTPYSNVCTITGITGTTVNHSGADTSTPTAYTYNWSGDAGTVYFGELDVLTGILTVTHGSVDLGDLDWTASGSGKFMYSSGISATVKRPASNDDVADLVCSHLRTTSATAVGTGEMGVGVVANNGNIRAAYTMFSTTPATFKTAVTGWTLVYELDTPVTYTLTPAEVLALSDDNNFWCSTNHVVTVRYKRQYGTAAAANIDATLTISGDAADAKVTGDLIRAITPYTMPTLWSNRVAEIRLAQGRQLTFAIQADPHFNVDEMPDENLFRNLAALTKVVNLDYVAVLGDIMRGWGDDNDPDKYMDTRDVMRRSLDEAVNRLRVAECPVLMTIGNHDTNYLYDHAHNDPPGIPYSELFARITKFTQKTCPQAVFNGSSLYYYVDFTSSNTRVIMLDTSDCPDGTVDGYGYYPLFGMTTAQLNWLNATLTDAKTKGFAVLVMAHVPLLKGTGECLTKNHISDYDTAVGHLTTFKNGGGKLIGCLYGHHHLQRHETINGILHVTFPISATVAEVCMIETGVSGGTIHTKVLNATNYPGAEALVDRTLSFTF